MGPISPPPVPGLDSLESTSISPRVRISPVNNITRAYRLHEEPAVTRFLIDKAQKNSEAEMEVFKRAIDHLQYVPSSEANLNAVSIPPRPNKPSNVVLVDIFEKREGVQPAEPAFHTVSLWKKTDQTWLMIDPSSYTFSERLIQPLSKLISQFNLKIKIDAKKHIGNKFYESLQKDQTRPQVQEGEKVNKDNRDCIDIALKIAFNINCSQQVAYDLATIESRIDYLSNQKSINIDLLQSGGEHIGWLQNSEACQREEAVRLLFENKDLMAFVVGVEDIRALQELNSMRLRVVKSPNNLNKNDFLNLIKECKNRLTLTQFAQFVDEWIKILQKESEAKKLRDEIVEKVRDEIKKGGKKP